MSVRIGQLTLSSNLFLAPMAGYTSPPFRMLIRNLGGLGLCTTDLVNARSLVEKHPKSFKLLRAAPGDEPLAVQLYGTEPEELRNAAMLLESRGVAMVDLNMGCPVRKVCRHGGGSALLGEPDHAIAIMKAMVEAVRIPVTCKMRLGLDEETLTAPMLARAFEDVGVAAITVHGRTRKQGFGGNVNVAGIRSVASAVRRIPVIGNGDITTVREAKRMFDETGCHGIGIGRGAFYNPWIFRQTKHFLETGEVLPEPDFEERVAFMTRHLEAMIAWYGEEQACQQFRKVALMYIKPFGPVVEFRRRVVELKSREELDEILAIYRPWRQAVLESAGSRIVLPA